MASENLFITIIDAESRNKPVLVRASSIDTLRPYVAAGRQRINTVVGVRNGINIHTTQTEEEIIKMIAGVVVR